MSAVAITKDIYWVGAVDWNVRSFHGHTYTTRRGTTYNAYLIVDEKIVLVDTVLRSFAPEMLQKIRQVVPLERIDYIITNHLETDHAGALPDILAACPKAQIICTARCKEGLWRHFYKEWDTRVVKTGDILKSGKKTLTFIEAPMIHWPDSMFTYLTEDRILMPNDAFGQHIATSGRFDDEVDQCALMDEAMKYYANILWPLGPVILKKIEELLQKKIPIAMIAPSHGVIWRKSPEAIINAYLSWAKNELKPKVVVAYETMWGATQLMARAIVEGIADSGVAVSLFDIASSDRTEVIKEMLDARGFILGSSTHDKDMLDTMAGFLHLLKGLEPKGRLGAAFGSYGWAGGAVKSIEGVLQSAGIALAQPGLGAKYVPDENELKQCYEFGKSFAAKLK